MFPRKQPRNKLAVPVTCGHVLHVAEYGPLEGMPIVYLHGGPGGGTPPDACRLFDPEVFRIVLFDQRGCGQSRCDDRLDRNTTDDLVADVEAVRAALGIERWAVMGSSYGSLLTALYAARHPSRVRFAVLHGVFLGSDEEVRWLYAEGGASMFYPEQWAAFEAAAAALPEAAVRAGVPSLLARYHAAIAPPGVSRAHPPPPDEGDGGGAAASLMRTASAALTAWEDDMETLAPCGPFLAPHKEGSGWAVWCNLWRSSCQQRQWPSRQASLPGRERWQLLPLRARYCTPLSGIQWRHQVGASCCPQIQSTRRHQRPASA